MKNYFEINFDLGNKTRAFDLKVQTIHTLRSGR